jgi:hypothetical protein
VKWLNGDDGIVEISLADYSHGGVQCRFPAKHGRAVVDHRALRNVRNPGTYFSVLSRGRAVVVAGEWGVEVAANIDAFWPDGTPARATVTPK